MRYLDDTQQFLTVSPEGASLLASLRKMAGDFTDNANLPYKVSTNGDQGKTVLTAALADFDAACDELDDI